MLIEGKPAPGVMKLSREIDERWPDDHYVAYYAHQFGVDDGQTARTVRELFPEERFTK